MVFDVQTQIREMKMNPDADRTVVMDRHWTLPNMVAMLDFLCSNQQVNVTKVRITGKALNADLDARLASYLRENHTVHTLDMWGRSCTVNTVYQLAQALKVNKTLRLLYITKTGFHGTLSDVKRWLADALRVNPTRPRQSGWYLLCHGCDPVNDLPALLK